MAKNGVDEKGAAAAHADSTPSAGVAEFTWLYICPHRPSMRPAARALRWIAKPQKLESPGSALARIVAVLVTLCKLL